MSARAHHRDTQLFLCFRHGFRGAMRPPCYICGYYLLLRARQHAERDDLRDTTLACLRQLFMRCAQCFEWHSMPARAHHRNPELRLWYRRALRDFLRTARHISYHDVFMPGGKCLVWNKLPGTGLSATGGNGNQDHGQRLFASGSGDSFGSVWQLLVEWSPVLPVPRVVLVALWPACELLYSSQLNNLRLPHRLHSLCLCLLPAKGNAAANTGNGDFILPSRLFVFAVDQQLRGTINCRNRQLFMPNRLVVRHKLYSATSRGDRELHLPCWQRSFRHELRDTFCRRISQLLMPRRRIVWHKLRHSHNTGHSELFMPVRRVERNELLPATNRGNRELYLPRWQHTIRDELHATRDDSAGNV